MKTNPGYASSTLAPSDLTALTFVTLVSIIQLGAASLTPAKADSAPTDLQVESIVEGLEHPWSLAFLPDGRQLLTERVGKLSIIDNGVLRPVSGVPPVLAKSQGGLFDVVLHPPIRRERLALPDSGARYRKA